MESEYMVYFFIQNKKTTALQVQSQVYESWNWDLVSIRGVSKNFDLGFWIEGIFFKKYI